MQYQDKEKNMLRHNQINKTDEKTFRTQRVLEAAVLLHFIMPSFTTVSFMGPAWILMTPKDSSVQCLHN